MKYERMKGRWDEMREYMNLVVANVPPSAFVLRLSSRNFVIKGTYFKTR